MNHDIRTTNHTLMLHIMFAMHLLHAVQLVLRGLLALLGHVVLVAVGVVNSTVTTSACLQESADRRKLTP